MSAPASAFHDLDHYVALPRVSGLALSPLEMLAAVVAFYIVLGCFMEPLPMMIVTVPVITPVVVSAGYDPIWFGILIVLLCETAMITPPVGVNLFVRLVR